MQIFNTLTRQKEEFVPQVPAEKKHVIELQKKMGSTELRSFVLKSLQTA